MLNLFNTLSGKIEEFKPIDEKNIKVYSCGLTVYDKAHIGHARATIAVDILVRLLKEIYGNVTYIRNITDVDDKINIKAKEKNITIQELTNEIIVICNEDMNYLNNLKPTLEPKATEHIDEIIKLIEKLIKNGNAYINNGHVLFDVNSYKNYGKLSKRKIEDLQSGMRINIEDYKKNPLDFVLWKPSLDIDDESSKFNSPWSIGRPGWHIECSAMSNKYLGENFDIHCGGVDLKFPHHENEIAQSCCAFENSYFAKYWYHIGFLMVNGEKMSKSLGNFVTIEEFRKKGIRGSVLRFAMMKNHYRKPLDFNNNLINESEKNLKDLHKNISNIDCDYKVPEEIIDTLNNDLNTPNAIALMNKFNKNKEYNKLKNTLIFFSIYDKDINNKISKISEKEINRLLEERIKYKKEKKWDKCDEIRNYLKENGILIKDTINGTEWFIE